MGELAVLPLAGCGEFAVVFAALSLRLALAEGDRPLPLPRFDAPAPIIILGIVGAAPPIEFAIQSAQYARIGCYLRAKCLKERLVFGDNGYGTRP